MRKFKKMLALTLVASMLLPNGVTAKEIAPTVGGNKATTQAVEQETPPTTTKETPVSIPTTVPSTIEAVTEAQSTEVTAEQVVTKEETPAKTVPSTDATDKVDDKIKDVELDTVKESNETERVTKDLLIKADEKSEIPSNGKVLSSHDNMYLVSFDTEDDAKKVYEDEKIDASLNTPFGIATSNEKGSDSVEPDVLDNLEEVIKDDDKNDDSFKITEEDYSIAVIDTGMPKGEKNIEFVSMLDDEGYDDHGHGALMLQSIREQDKDAKILSIKALDKNGYGDAATIYAALKYAIERKVDVINLSISGYATEGNKIIEDVIKEAVSKGIIVVGAAGNDNLPASAFIPGGIDEIIVVGACNEKNERRSFSNYGITVDYYANANSTSQASATVAGAISVNKGDISKLDDKFFKTPDLSIFDEDLKNYRNSKIIDETDPDYIDVKLGHGEKTEKISDEEFLLNRLIKYINYGGFSVADVADDLRITNNVVESPRKAIRNAYANTHYYVLSASKININDIIVQSADPKWKVGEFSMTYNAGGDTKYERYVYYDLGDTASKTDESMDSTKPLTITFPQCVVDSEDGSLHDWIITISRATFHWAPHDSNDEYKHSRIWCPLIELHDKSRPWFTSGAKETDSTDKYWRVDSFNECDFTQTVYGAADNSVLLTGFEDLDIYNKYPNTNANETHYSETIAIHNVGATGGQIWTSNDSLVDLFNYGTNGVRFEGNGNGIDTGDIKGTVLLAVDPRGNTGCTWLGPRCQTAIGLSMANVVETSTVNTYINVQAKDGSFPAWQLATGHPATGYPGSTYTYTYDGQYAGTYHNVAGTWGSDDTTQARYNTSNRTISYPYKSGDATFYLAVPRMSFTYSFNENKPSGATGNVTNMPDSITKLAENICGNYNREPSLTDYKFIGFFDTPAATGGNQYNAGEEMVSNKTFYARWQPYHTYYFHDNKPSNATSNVTNMPDNIRKLEGSTCGDYNRTPSLKGWIFKGFYDTQAATGGNAYNPNESMYSDKHFYARWEPMKYYVRYNGNGTTNFNENATNGMQAGEYHQNTVTGSTAYQIFTYDSTGEALRQNGFTRRGYDFVCWNTTPTRTGADRNPGYVKPATENWVKGDGTDPTATLDGTHTYPVVDLYAIWRQKLGTETLTVVSEETGNPVANVNVKLTNTSNNNQVTTGTTNAQGKVTVNNLHWFPYKWSSTSVPAGYKAMQDVAFDINPARTPDNEDFLTVNDNRILYMKHVSLKINSKVSDIIDGENAPAFMYHITGQDVAGVTHSYDVMVQIDAESETGYNVVPVATNGEEPYMFAGNYTITQYDVSRYIAGNAENVSNTTPVGKNATANLTNNDFAEVLFPYTIKQYGGFSGVHSLINKLTK